jgi:phosphotransferase system enzyme I (PtsI)
MAANPLGIFLLIGLGITAVSVSPSSLPEIKKVIRSVPAGEARAAVAHALTAGTPNDVIAALTDGLAQWLDLSMFAGRWNLTSNRSQT